MARSRQAVPGWFRIVAVVFVLWGLAGCWFWYTQFRYGAESWGPGITDWDRAFYAALPVWYNAVYAVSVFGGLGGAIALLLRSKLAIPLFAISLAGIVVMFGYTFIATGLIAQKGIAEAIGFPLFIAALGVFQLWLALRARARGWIV